MAIYILLSLQVLVPRQFARVCRRVNMNEGVKENHVAVIALHNCGKSHSKIVELGADWPKSTPKTEDHVPRAEHINLINVSHCQGQSTHERLPVVKGAPPYTRFEGVPSVGPRGVQASTSWTINCGLFWRIWCAESVTTTWRA